MKITKAKSLEGLTVTKGRRVDNNTFEIEYPNGNRAIRLHLTDIITFKPDNTIVLNSGGWRTHTTKDRINSFLPRTIRLWQEKRVWYINSKDQIFFDGMILNSEGYLVDAKSAPKMPDRTQLKVRIKKFCAKIDNLESIPLPMAGDCWYCYMRTEGGKSLGEAQGNTDHLSQHLKDGYLHGSLIFEALKASKYNNPVFIMQAGIKQSIKLALYKFLLKKLAPELA